jgi:peroxiredoxin
LSRVVTDSAFRPHVVLRGAVFALAITAAVGLAPAQPYPLRYRLPTGRKLVYLTRIVTEFGKGSSGAVRQMEIWVLHRNGDGSWPLIIRQTSSSWRDQGNGTRTGGEPETSWARSAIFPDGRLVRRYFSGDINPGAFFIPLPADTLAARAGWEHHDPESEETDVYHLLGQDLHDTLWQIEDIHRTPFDEVYEISSRAGVIFNARQGLTVRKEAESNQSYGNRRTLATTTLDRVAPSDTVWVRNFEPQLDVFLRADSMLSELTDSAEVEPGRAVALLNRADSLLKAARCQVADSGLLRLIDNAIGDNDRAATRAYLSPGGRPTDSLIGKPAPDWTLIDLDGTAHALTGYRGSVVLLDFWYRGCPWCIRAMPQINKLAADYAGQAVRVFGMNVDKDTADARFVTGKLKLGYPQLQARSVSKSYKVGGYPTLFIIDREGILREVHIGYTPDVGRRAATAVERLLSGK